MPNAANTAFAGNPHRISVSDNLRCGNAEAPNRDKNSMGVPINGAEAQHVAVFNLGAPAVAAANNVALSQSVTGVGTAFLLNGALASTVGTLNTPFGAPTLAAVLDVPRNVVAAWTGVAIITITGKDEYGQTMSEVSPSGSAHTGKKAFKYITSITTNASITLATVGTGSVLGLQYRPVVGGFVAGLLNENTADAGTYVPPERVASTTTTNDVRGTYAPAGALNGANVYTVKLAVRGGGGNDGTTSPNGTSFAYGIPQV